MFTLESGDTIGIVSPSSPVTATAPIRTERAVQFLESKGFKIKMGTLAGKRDAYRSASIRERADEINRFIRDDEVKCIMSSMGGMNSNSLVPYLDYLTFSQKPKAVIGYSDFTAILFALYARTGHPTFYGPALVPSFGELEPYNQMAFRYFNEIFSSPSMPYLYEKPLRWTEEFIDWETQDREKVGQPNQWITLKEGTAEGRMIIGNLNTFSGFWGSSYFPPIREGDILFIEDSLKDAATIERSFSMLKLNGVFDKIGGLILGKHELFDDCGTGKHPYEILEEVLGDYDFPFLADVDCCHTLPMFTMPVGGRVSLDGGAKTLTLLSLQSQ